MRRALVTRWIAVVFLAVFLAALWLAPVAALADARRANAPERPVVELITEVLPPDQAIAALLEKFVVAELAARDIDVVHGETGARPVLGRIRLRVDHLPSGRVLALIQIGDNVTDKRVERTMDLTAMPPDARPLAVATSADELLRASWAELRMTDAPAPAMTPPPTVLAAVAWSLREAEPERRWEFGALVIGSFFAQRAGLGGAALVGRELFPRWYGLGRAGAESGLTSAAPHGRVRADTRMASLGVGFAPTRPTAAIGLRLECDARFVQATYLPSAAAGALAHEQQDWALLSGLGARLTWDRGFVRLHAGLAGLVAWRPSAATDSGQTVASIGRFGGEVTLGFSVRP
jgi:hypothetical protein